MDPLVVSIRLQNGYVAVDPWSPAIDGILAALMLQEQLGADEYALGMSGGAELIAPDLPLEKQSDDTGNWWWSCSAPVVDDAFQHEKWFHRRFDFALGIDRVNEKTRRVQTQGGPFKAYRNRETIIVPKDRLIRWHVIGDRGEIARLLRRCTYVGKGGARGHGVVFGIDVTPNGANKAWARNHRPLPVATAWERGIDGPVTTWGIRPPGRIPAHQTLCVMP